MNPTDTQQSAERPTTQTAAHALLPVDHRRPPTDQLTTTPGNPAVTVGNLWSPVVTVGNQIRRTRNGKVARLPKPHRDLVNRMLFNNIPHDKIVAALDTLGVCVTPRNISNWKTRGGYREWRLSQEHALQIQLHQDNLIELLRRYDTTDIPEVGLQAAATELSQFFLTPQAAELRASNPNEYHRRLTALGRLSLQLKALQQYRAEQCADNLHSSDDPFQLRAEAEADAERLREEFSSTPSESADIPDTPHRNYLPK